MRLGLLHEFPDRLGIFMISVRSMARHLGLVSAVFAATIMIGASAVRSEPVQLKAADGVIISGDYESAQGSKRPLILLFHQASSSHHEYDPIAPKLNQLGFDTLAIDQRSGGSLYGRNETAAGVRGRADFLDAYKDLEAALAWAKTKQPGSKIIAWGSSYSASLVFKLAADHPADIAAVLSFSPGEYFSSGHFVRDAAAKVKVPVFVTSADDAGEVGEARKILAAVPGSAKTQFVPKQGVHGSSTLRQDRNGAGAAENWKAVEAFLSGFR